MSGPVRAVVREWHGDEGWGVLDGPGLGDGCWAHFSVVDMPGNRVLAAGQAVLVEYERAQQDGFTIRAVSVRT